MENRKLIYLFGMMFSIVFSLVYFFLFTTFISSEASSAKTIYFNQVGLYKDVENSTKMIETLKGKNMEAYPIQKEDVTAVVCGISEDPAQTRTQQEALTNMEITFIEKSVTIEDSEILSLFENKEFKKALELMKY